MSKVDKTVFISYRRTNKYHALALFKELGKRGYDVFLDYDFIKSGDFEQIILQEIEARGHFVIVLTPSALERCDNPGDWLRREIEHALLHKRNIIPLMFDGFDFDDADQYLTGKLQLVKKYNGLTVPFEYFDAAIDKLETFLAKPIDTILHPTPQQHKNQVKQAIEKAKVEPQPTHDELTAEQYFERAYNRDKTDYDGQIHDYTEAIRLNPDYAEAYNNRGLAYYQKEQYDRAIDDFCHAIRLRPDDANMLVNRGLVYNSIGEHDRAIDDFNKAIQLQPDHANAYINRGLAYSSKRQYDRAIDDFNEAIQLQPDDAGIYYNRGVAYGGILQYDLAIDDFNEVIQLQPDYAEAYNNRGWSYFCKYDYYRAINDYNTAIRLKPDGALIYRNRGIVYTRRGNLQRANDDYQKYIDLGGEDPDEVQKWIAENKRKMG